MVYGIPWGGDADTWKMINGKLYIFGGRGSIDAFMIDRPSTESGAGRQVLGRRGQRQQQLLAAQQTHGVAGATLQEWRGAGQTGGSRQSQAVNECSAKALFFK
jgi:hypothetical protein